MDSYPQGILNPVCPNLGLSAALGGGHGARSAVVWRTRELEGISAPVGLGTTMRSKDTRRQLSCGAAFATLSADGFSRGPGFLGIGGGHDPKP